METGQIGNLLAEVLLFSVLMYAFVRFLQETRGSAVLKGFIFLLVIVAVCVVILGLGFDLVHVEYLADRGLYILLFALVIVFQPELRQALVRLGDSRMLHTLTRSRAPRENVIDVIVESVERLAKQGFGALMVIERTVGISGFAEQGTRLDAQISVPLLTTLFTKDTPLHDGAVLIRGHRVVAAGCLLPLTERPNLSPLLGTRHRAAIGATEENDALAVVVSEETRRISYCHQGDIFENQTPEQLRRVLIEKLVGAKGVQGE